MLRGVILKKRDGSTRIGVKEEKRRRAERD